LGIKIGGKDILEKSNKMRIDRNGEGDELEAEAKFSDTILETPTRMLCVARSVLYFPLEEL